MVISYRNSRGSHNVNYVDSNDAKVLGLIKKIWTGSRIDFPLIDAILEFSGNRSWTQSKFWENHFFKVIMSNIGKKKRFA